MINSAAVSLSNRIVTTSLDGFGTMETSNVFHSSVPTLLTTTQFDVSEHEPVVVPITAYVPLAVGVNVALVAPEIGWLVVQLIHWYEDAEDAVNTPNPLSVAVMLGELLIVRFKVTVESQPAAFVNTCVAVVFEAV